MHAHQVNMYDAKPTFPNSSLKSKRAVKSSSPATANRLQDWLPSALQRGFLAVRLAMDHRCVRILTIRCPKTC